MSSGTKFEASLRLALMEAAERQARRSRPLNALAAIPSQLRAKTASVPKLAGAAVAVAAAAGALLFGALLAFGPHQASRPLPRPEVVARLQLGDSLGSAVAGFGSLWLDDTSRNQILRLDSHTRRVVARIPVHGEASTAVGTTAVWVLQASSSEMFVRHGPLLRVDPRTNRVTGSVPLRTPSGEPFLGYDVVTANGDLWVWGPFGALRIDPRTLRVTTVIELPRRSPEPNGFAIWHNRLWGMSNDNQLLQFDLRTGAKRSQMQLRPEGAPTDFGVAGDAMIATVSSGMERLDPSTGRIVWHTALGRVEAWTEERGLIWAVSTSPLHDRLSAIDPDTGRVVTDSPLTDFGAQQLAAAEGHLWLSLTDGQLLVIRP
jgi:hypothetical protein